MGRPIKKLYIGNRNTDGIGGEGVSSASVWIEGDGYFTANAAIAFTAPQLPNGTTATGSLELDANGAVTGVTITNSGTGYTSTPTASITGANASPAFANVTLTTSSVADAIAVSAYIPGGSSALVGDIIAQKGTKTYRVQTADGTGECTLVTSAPGEGEMRITATDSAGGTYFVKKLFNQTVVVLPGTGIQFAEDAKVDWTALDVVNGGYKPVVTPVEDVSVTIIN
jgi:hypothetical protein